MVVWWISEKLLIQYSTVQNVGLLNTLLQINAGCFYTLVKSLYLNSTCSIKIGQNQTRLFIFQEVYVRDVF